jgi:hypothetical protein
MGLDIRLPIALLFAVLGGLLAIFGAFSDRSIYSRSLGINVNLLWGSILFIFGTALWLAAKMGAKAASAKHRAPNQPAAE